MAERSFAPRPADLSFGYGFKHVPVNDTIRIADEQNGWYAIPYPVSKIAATRTHTFFVFDASHFMAETLDPNDPSYTEALANYEEELQQDPTMMIYHGTEQTVILRRRASLIESPL